MSGQSGSRTKTSPKQGPLRATMPLSSVTKEGSALRSTSPPYWQPEVFGRRSPGAPFSKGASPRAVRGIIRRTASLDAIYLRGLFPRENIFWHRDRATQTDRSNSLDSLQNVVSSDNVEDKLTRLTLRQRRRSCSRDSNTDRGDQTLNSQVRSASSPIAKNSISVPPKSSRSSEEGLNQEIELYSVNLAESHCDRLKEPIPEGRKAPVAELIREGPYSRTHQQSVNQNSSEESSSPDQDRMLSGSSPQINRFSSRAPPDGCERVLSKSVPILRPIPREVVSHPTILFTLKPSSHSAFESLRADKELEAEQVDGETDRDSPKVPDQEDP